MEGNASKGHQQCCSRIGRVEIYSRGTQVGVSDTSMIASMDGDISDPTTSKYSNPLVEEPSIDDDEDNDQLKRSFSLPLLLLLRFQRPSSFLLL